MLPAVLDQLRSGASALGVMLSDTQVSQLDRYVERLLTWNEKVNLTAVTDPMGIVDKHLLDCLALVPLAAETGTVVDIGTGPGLPSIVLSIARPQLEITAVESILKKAMFVRTVARELGLGIRVEPVRLESIAPEQTFDLAVSRATFEPSEWVERGAALVRTGGQLIAMLSEHQPHPPSPPGWASDRLIEHQLGGAIRRIACYRRPLTSA